MKKKLVLFLCILDLFFNFSKIPSNIFFLDAFEDTRSTVMQDDQKPDVSDQSIRAQEFAVTLADPPLSSSSDTGTLYLLETTPSDYLILLI